MWVGQLGTQRNYASNDDTQAMVNAGFTWLRLEGIQFLVPFLPSHGQISSLVDCPAGAQHSEQRSTHRSKNCHCCRAASTDLIPQKRSPDQRFRGAAAAAMAAANKAVKVYGWAVSPYVARALLALEEAGVEYELVPMSRDAGDHRRPDHLARNPFGQVPVLEDGDLTLFESRAIARHVLRKHKPELLGGGSLEQSAMVDVWLEVEAHQHHPAAGAIVMQCLITPLIGGERDQAVVDENAGKLRAVFEIYEARLSRSRYLAGDFVSAADLSHFPLMRYFMATEYAAMVEALPHVRAWWEDLAARPAARKVAELMPLDFGLSKKDEQ